MRKLRKLLCFALLAAMLLGLCACDASSNEPVPTATAAPVTAEPSAAPMRELTEKPRETVPGYIASEISNPYWVKNWGACDIYNDTFYIAAKTTDGAPAVAAFDTRTEEFTRIDLMVSDLHNPSIYRVSVAADTLWLLVLETQTQEEAESNSCQHELNTYIICVNLVTGEESRSMVSFWDDDNAPLYFLLALDNDRALTGNDFSEKHPIYLIDRNAKVIGAPETVLYGNPARVWVNGVHWVAAPGGLAQLDPATIQYSMPIPELTNQPALYSSSLGHFLVTQDNVLYNYDPATQQATEILKWADVAFSYKRLYGRNGLENENGDIFHLTDRITKISMGDVPVKDTLILACLGDTSSYGYPTNGWGLTSKTFVCSDALMDAVLRFNNSDSDYRVEIKPYIYSSEEERTRLLIELATSGKVDIIDTSLLPDGAVDSSMLVDLLPYLDADADISREDFIPGVLSAMMRGDALYEYIDRFDILTMSAPKILADGGEWTAERMCQLLAEYPDLRTENNAENLVLLFSRAATAEFMDTSSATCSFTDPAFGEWLKLLKALTTSTYTNLHTDIYTFFIDYDFPSRVGDKSRVTAGGDYAVVGFPNADETGCYFMRYGAPTAMGVASYITDSMMTMGANTSLGIMAASANIDGAWRFIKTYMSGAEDVELMYGIPALKVSFERAVENELDKDTPNQQFTKEDAEIIKSIVYGTTKYVLNSPEVIDTMRTILNAYLGGQYTEAAAAAQLQSRLSIYLAEKYG